MPTVVTQTLTFNYLDEYSNIVSLYNESLLLPIQIKVGNIFALKTGTLTLCASMDNIVYNDKFVFSTQNNASINIPATQVVGSFVKLRRQLTSYTNSTISTQFSSTFGSNIVFFDDPVTLNKNDRIGYKGSANVIGFVAGNVVNSFSAQLKAPSAYTLGFNGNRNIRPVRQSPEGICTLNSVFAPAIPMQY
jgi:hypothetical protein